MINKNAVMTFLKNFGWEVTSEEALVEIDGGQPDGDGPNGNEETQTLEPQTRTVVVNNTETPEPELPEHLAQFVSLVDEIGGFDQFAGLLLNAAELQQNAALKEEARREALIEILVANSADLTEEELTGLELPALEMMARIVPEVDYSAIGLRTHKRDEPAPAFIEAPAFFLKSNSDEDES